MKILTSNIKSGKNWEEQSNGHSEISQKFRKIFLLKYNFFLNRVVNTRSAENVASVAIFDFDRTRIRFILTNFFFVCCNSHNPNFECYPYLDRITGKSNYVSYLIHQQQLQYILYALIPRFHVTFQPWTVLSINPFLFIECKLK